MMNMKNIINNNNVVPSYRQRTPSKVRTIPIHFVGSERSRENSAIKIQKVLRGFFVRNALKRIMGLRVELQSVEAKVYASMEVIKRDQRERVRLSETIMNLLLKLDSVRVLSSWYGVRECRKSVIKKAIALQEMVESESACVVEENRVQEEEKVVEVSEEKEEEKMEVMDDDSGADIKCVSESCMNSSVEEEKMEDSGVDIQCVSESYKIEEKEEGDGEREESVGTSLVEENENNCVVKNEEEEEEEEEEEGNGDEERREGKHREMLEKMMEDNERMMKMMAKLCERNEMQTQLLTSLSKRVEQLERAFACDKMRRNKRRNCSDAKHKQNMNK